VLFLSGKKQGKSNDDIVSVVWSRKPRPANGGLYMKGEQEAGSREQGEVKRERESWGSKKKKWPDFFWATIKVSDNPQGESLKGPIICKTYNRLCGAF
jgi:hypothetical protein